MLDAPAVLAVVVTRDGGAWLDEVLRALAAQDHPDLTIVAVDNGSLDDSRDILSRHLQPDDVFVGDAAFGFGRAAEMAMIARPDAPLVVLVHDDLILAPDAVSLMVAAIQRDPTVAIVGPKLVDLDGAGLQSVGWTIDRTGRVASTIEPGERDQGQHDAPSRPFVVSTAGMMLRRDVYLALGGFDTRFHLFREDLDLCWRAWSAGWEVENRPRAVGRHARSAANFQRVDPSPLQGARYHAERNTLATLLKNYDASRLAIYLFVFVLVGGAKVLGFLATRRVGDAAQTVRAWGWNVANLSGTWRRRKLVQTGRRRGDHAIAAKFSRIGPRFRAYGEAVGDWALGGSATVVEVEENPDTPPTVRERLVSMARRRPVMVAGSLLLVIGAAVCLPLYGTGVLRGGELAPFPISASLFFENYVASWHDAGGVGTATAPSPVALVLGATQFLTFGSAWGASRLVIIGAVPLAWFLALRAGRWLTPTTGPRVAAATLYVLSPPVLAAFRTGRLTGLVMAMALPGVLAAAPYLATAGTSAATAWRSAAALILVLALVVSFVPSTLPVIGVLLLGMAAAAIRAQGLPGLTRVIAVGAGLAAVCFPWSLRWVGSGSPVVAAVQNPDITTSALWRWLILSPDATGFPLQPAGIGLVIAALFGVIVGTRSRRNMVIALWAAAMVGAILAVMADRSGSQAWVWPGVPSMVTSAAFAGLFAVGLRSIGARLAGYEFGWRQLGAGVMLGATLVGIAGTVLPAIFDPLDEYTQGTSALPAFLAAESNAATSRILTIVADGDRVTWEMTGPAGPTLLNAGVTFPLVVRDRVNEALADVLGGSDPGAAGRLGLLNIAHVYVPASGTSDTLARALDGQLDLEPRPIETGSLFRVTGFVGRVSFASPDAIATIRRRGAADPTQPLIAFDAAGAARWSGAAPRDGSVLVSEASAPGWIATTAEGVELERQTTAGLVRFDVAETTSAVVVAYGRQPRRSLAVLVQLLAIFLTASVVFRPPGQGPPEGLS